MSYSVRLRFLSPSKYDVGKLMEFLRGDDVGAKVDRAFKEPEFKSDI